MEHQLKLHSESLQQRVDELEKELNDKKDKPVKLNWLIYQKPTKPNETAIIKDKKDIEISSLKTEIQGLKHIIKSYDEQSVKLSELEKKLKIQNLNHNKEMKEAEDKYKNKILSFSKKLESYEELIKANKGLKTINKRIDEEAELTNVYLV